MRERDKFRTKPAQRQNSARDEPAFGLLLAVIVAGLLWLALMAVVAAVWR